MGSLPTARARPGRAGAGWLPGRSRSLETRKVAERKEISRTERLVRGATGVVVVLVAWQLLSSHHIVNQVLWSSPSGIWSSFLTLVRNGTLGTACSNSGELFLISFALSLAVGVILGVILGWYQRSRAIIDPWVSMLYATPRIALIPLVIAIFGLGLKTQVLTVMLLAVFPIIINVAAGVQAMDRDQLRVARSYLATNWDVLRGVALPGALPYIVAGVQQGLVMTLNGIVVAEYFVGNNGIGGLIINASQNLQTGDAFVGATIFALASLLLTALLRGLDQKVARWR
jgi:ABC-type nitrate/sulfonate/bicarbonate transport system permease component